MPRILNQIKAHHNNHNSKKIIIDILRKIKIILIIILLQIGTNKNKPIFKISNHKI
jgi:hypothetical protein